MKRADQADNNGVFRLRPLAIVSVAVLVIVGAFSLTYIQRAPGSTVGKGTAKVGAVDPWIAEKAREVGGDYKRLDPADAERLNHLTMGHGAEVLRAAASH